MRTYATCVAVLAAMAFTGCNRSRGSGGKTPSTDDEKTFYTLGLMLGRNLGNFNLTPEELEFVKAGLSDVALRREFKVDFDNYSLKVNALGRQRAQQRVALEMESARVYLERAAHEPGAVVSPSGLVFRTVKPGTGDTPKPTDRVSIQYEGRLTDGTIFESTRKSGGVPVTVPLGGAIGCWNEGLGKMKIGEKAVLGCPPAIGYGDHGRPPTIPGGAALIFDVELVGIAPPNVTSPASTIPALGAGNRPGGPSMMPFGEPGGAQQRLALPPPHREWVDQGR